MADDQDDSEVLVHCGNNNSEDSEDEVEDGGVSSDHDSDSEGSLNLGPEDGEDMDYINGYGTL